MAHSLINGARVFAVCLVAVAPLAACESFDPMAITDLLPDGKKKLTGDRKEVFPTGVPGVQQGVPSELRKGNQPAPEASALAAPEIPAQTEEAEEKPKPKPKPKVAARPARPPASVAPANPQTQSGSAPWPAQQSQQTQPQAGWPAPPPPAR